MGAAAATGSRARRWAALLALALAVQAGEKKPASGAEIFRSACAACHGFDGKGASQAFVGFDTPLPDFSDCNFSIREPDADWAAIVHLGGPARGFSPIMPSFGEALSADEIGRVIEYLRDFCQERPRWPHGNLNLPRAIITEKAFPEDEVLLTTIVNAEGAPAITQRILYEKRFGARNQIEVLVPMGLRRPRGAEWAGGVGDIALGYKRVLAHSQRTGSAFSLSGEVVLPTGDKRRGFGRGVTLLETFATYGQVLPADSFFQFQGGFKAPTRGDDASKGAFWRFVGGKTFAQDGGFGRSWSPMVEFLADRDFRTGAVTNWDVLPQVQVSLNTRQHILANFGVRIPATNTSGRPVQILVYLLWDWFDGGLRDGW